MTAPASVPRRTSTQKVLAVLEVLPRTTRISEVAQLAHLPVSTVHRILAESVSAKWVAVNDHQYLPGPKMLSLVRGMDADRGAAQLAYEPLRELCERTGYTVHLAFRHGGSAVYALKLEGRRSYLMRSRVGDSLALHTTAIGKSVLALLPEQEVRDYVEQSGLPRLTDATITDGDALLEHLARVRRRAWAMDDGENEEQTRCVGAPVVNDRGLPLGGVSLSALAFDLPMETAHRLAVKVMKAARQVSAALASA